MARRLQLSAAITTVTAALLTACGGGSSTPETKNPPQIIPTNATAAANATATGATAISTDTNKLVFDLVADVGDSWQITLDKTAKTFVLKVVQTQYNVPETTGTFTSSTASGGRITYTLTDNAKNAIGTLTADDATQSAAGNIAVKSTDGATTVNAAVSGTAFKATALEKLAGTYNFIRASRNAGNGQYLDGGAGQAVIAADGKSMKLCLLGTFVNGTCTSIVGEGTPEEGTLNLALDSFGRIAVSNVIDGVSSTFGLGSIVASDLVGPAKPLKPA